MNTRSSWIKLKPGNWGLKQAVVGFIITVVSALIPTIALQATIGQGNNPDAILKSISDNAYYVMPLQYLLMFFIGAVVMRLWNGKKYKNEHLGFVKPKIAKTYLWGAGGGVLFVIIGQLAANLIPSLTESGAKVASQIGLGESVQRDFFVILAVTIGAPLGEEMGYRAIIFKSLYDKFSKFKISKLLVVVLPIIISSLLFAIAHGGEGQSKQLGVLLIFGVIASLLYLRTGSLYIPVFAHSVCNSINILLLASKSGLTSPLFYVFVILAPLISIATVKFTETVLKTSLKSA